MELYLHDNEISDISPLSILTNLTWLGLDHNKIADISPLIKNSGIDMGDEVAVRDNPLNSEAINIHIPELEDRGVNVVWEAEPPATTTPAPTTPTSTIPTSTISPTTTSPPTTIPPQRSFLHIGILGTIVVLIFAGYYMAKKKHEKEKKEELENKKTEAN